MNETQSVVLADHLTEDRIIFYKQPITKIFILTDLVGKLHYQNPQAAITAILEREKSGSTVITPGVSVPHARMVDLPDVKAAMGICLEGVENMKGEEELLRIILVFLGPANHMKRNLDFLASVSFLFSTEGVFNELLSATNAAEVLRGIRRNS